jgi:hypothetical protein
MNGSDRELLWAARNGDISARATITRELENKSPRGRTLYDGLCSSADAWVAPVLRDIALGKLSGDDDLALSAWWRILSGTDLTLPRAVIDRPAASATARRGAIKLLASRGDEYALDLVRRDREAKCAEALKNGQLGLILGEPPFESTSWERLKDDAFIVVHVCPGSRGARFGFKAGDEIEQIDGVSFSDWAQARRAIFALATTTKPTDVGVKTISGAFVVRTVKPFAEAR